MPVVPAVVAGPFARWSAVDPLQLADREDVRLPGEGNHPFPSAETPCRTGWDRGGLTTRSATGASLQASALKRCALCLPVQGECGLQARWLCSTGLRISEVIQLRVRVLDFAQQAPIMREGKGAKGRVVMEPQLPLVELRHLLGTWSGEGNRLEDFDFVYGGPTTRWT